MEAEGAYRNAKGRMPYISDAFVYVDLQAARIEIVNFLGDFGFYEPGYLESILRIFPAFAASVEFNEGEWYAESFIAIDKDPLGGEGFFEHSKKYRHDLLKYTSEANFMFEWGGHDLTAQLNRLKELFEILNPSAATVFESSIVELTERFFGASVPIQDLGPLLDAEYYLGWTPSSDFLFLLELNGEEEEVSQAAFMKDFFIQNYKYPKKSVLENGEVRAELKTLDASMDKHADMPFYRMAVDGETVFALGITEDLLVLSGSEQTFFAAVDKIQTGQDLRMTNAYDSLLSGSDELNILNLNFFD